MSPRVLCQVLLGRSQLARKSPCHLKATNSSRGFRPIPPRDKTVLETYIVDFGVSYDGAHELIKIAHSVDNVVLPMEELQNGAVPDCAEDGSNLVIANAIVVQKEAQDVITLHEVVQINDSVWDSDVGKTEHITTFRKF